MCPHRLSRLLILILLALSSFGDDQWACITPDPDDNAFAAENNEYLASARTPRGVHRCKGEGPWRTTTFPSAANPRPPEHLLHLKRGTNPFVLFDRDPLFGFMSLQR